VLAGYLGLLGAGPKVLIGIYLERSFDQIVSILAIMKTGGAFLPLEPAWPETRLRKLFNDARASLVVTSADYAGALAADNRAAIVLDCDREKIASVGNDGISPFVRRE
jgi:non-ribosomal peptide synthetase component F